jgi:NAD-dependent dihydropyrimidine dehydrogenase PreA subunit
MSKTRAAASSPSLPVFRRDRCKHCGICVHFCPKGAIGFDAEQYPELVDPEACTACRLCEHLCPDFGVKVP